MSVKRSCATRSSVETRTPSRHPGVRQAAPGRVLGRQVARAVRRRGPRRAVGHQRAVLVGEAELEAHRVEVVALVLDRGPHARRGRRRPRASRPCARGPRRGRRRGRSGRRGRRTPRACAARSACCGRRSPARRAGARSRTCRAGRRSPRRRARGAASRRGCARPGCRCSCRARPRAGSDGRRRRRGRRGPPGSARRPARSSSTGSRRGRRAATSRPMARRTIAAHVRSSNVSAGSRVGVVADA